MNSKIKVIVFYRPNILFYYEIGGERGESDEDHDGKDKGEDPAST